MASEPGLNNTNVSNCSSFWQLNPDCFNYNQNVLQIKSTNAQYNNATYQSFPSTSNFYQPHINSYINSNKSPLYPQVFNSEFHASNDNESFKFYPNGNYCTLPGRNSNLANNSAKSFFNPMYPSNFFEAKPYQQNYSNFNVISNESFLTSPTNEQKWPLNQNLPDSSLTNLNLNNQQEKKCLEEYSESSQDSSNSSVKIQSILNSKTDLTQVKTQNSNQKKTRTKDKYRVVYTELQRNELEKEFNFSKYITSRKKSELALELGLSQRQIKIWFQNRRAKDRKMSKKKKNDQNVNAHVVNSSMNIQNSEFNESRMNTFEAKQFSWHNDPIQVRTFAEVNVQLNRHNQQNSSSEFLVYNQNGLNYGI